MSHLGAPSCHHRRGWLCTVLGTQLVFNKGSGSELTEPCMELSVCGWLQTPDTALLSSFDGFPVRVPFSTPASSTGS